MMDSTFRPVSTTSTPPATILVGVQLPPGEGSWPVAESLAELAELARTAGLNVIHKSYQSREKPHHHYYVGTGKLEEIKQVVQEQHAEVVVCDDELTPAQLKNLEQELNVRIMDRTSLILHIFALHSRSYESSLQVEHAQLQYLRPRLTRLWKHLSRLGGGIGTRGPGEKQLEVDRRQIDKRIKTIQEKLEKIRAQRKTTRIRRHHVPIVTGAILGYTNAGKSTLLNTLTKANVYAEDLLFATLDPTTRQLQLPSHETILLTDTVGFIQKLPHELVSAFRATLEEVIEADFIIHVVDASHSYFQAMIATAEQVLKELKADHLPQIYVFNKVDKVSKINALKRMIEPYTPHVLVSALTGDNINGLLEEIQRLLQQYHKTMTYVIPYQRMDVVHMLHRYGKVMEEAYDKDKIVITADINQIVGEKIMANLYQPQE